MRSLMVAVMTAGAVVVFAAPARAACSICQIQSKIASTTAPGKFDYRVSCISEVSGDEIVSAVTASSDEEAVSIAQQKC